MPSLSQIRYYGILDTGYVSRANWLDAYDALAAGGAGIIQVRAKRETPDERAALVEAVMERRAASDALHEQPHLVINDDIELCLRHPSIGLHVGQEDLPAAEARKRLGPDRILGLSTHSRTQASRAMELGPAVLSYFAVGPVFATQTKPDYEPVGLELVRFVAELQPELPFFCIGGINRGNIARVIATGAARIVTVSDVLCDPDTAGAVRESIELLNTARPEN